MERDWRQNQPTGKCHRDNYSTGKSMAKKRICRPRAGNQVSARGIDQATGGGMNVLCAESVRIQSLGDKLAGSLFVAETFQPSPVLIVCHGAGEFKENYYELCE